MRYCVYNTRVTYRRYLACITNVIYSTNVHFNKVLLLSSSLSLLSLQSDKSFVGVAVCWSIVGGTGACLFVTSESNDKEIYKTHHETINLLYKNTFTTQYDHANKIHYTNNKHIHVARVQMTSSTRCNILIDV